MSARKIIRKSMPIKARSPAFEAILDAAQGLHRVGVIDQKTMREYRTLCIEPVKIITAGEVVSIRRNAQVSQNLFARYLNTSPSTVQKWESGAKRPSGMAAKLLSVVKKRDLKVLAQAISLSLAPITTPEPPVTYHDLSQ